MPAAGVKRFAARATGALTLPPVLAGCDAPLSTLAPAGPVAREIAWLWWAMLGGAAVLTLLVLVLLAMAFGPPRKVAARRWTHGLGLGLSLPVLAVTLAAGLWVGERILPRDDGALEIEVHAVQWSWAFTAPGPDGPVTTRDRLILPAGAPVDLIITSGDVIHSFWVPKLGGKMDAIPGRANRLRLQADAPGTLAGQCAEFCGLGHAVMRFEVEVVDPADWENALRAAADDGDAADD
ncbi:MAG: cytochrome c oxidase subunit II [Rhodobacteraceae bacterium]|nr:cytochrome c oxidase subunit II [Paracoccaceae bacterium]